MKTFLRYLKFRSKKFYLDSASHQESVDRIWRELQVCAVAIHLANKPGVFLQTATKLGQNEGDIKHRQCGGSPLNK